MASLELRNRTYRVVFMHRGKKYGYSLGTDDPSVAEGFRGGVEKTLMLIAQGALAVPDGVDVITFVRSGGKTDVTNSGADDTQPMDDLTLRELIDDYLAVCSGGSMEANSVATVQMHLNHVAATLGNKFRVQALEQSGLQQHVDARAKKRYRGRPLSPATLRKEVASFRACWNWAVTAKKLSGPFPNRGLKYPKATEALPYMTWAEIERRVTRKSGITSREREDLWNCLYLDDTQIAELLQHVHAHGAQPFLYPMIATAAHTGARRSELLRITVDDVNFDDGTIRIHEKKRSKVKRTTRTVPMSNILEGVLREWLREHPGGDSLFCHQSEVFRSKKRSRSTGHPSGDDRPTSLDKRLASVKPRPRPPLGPLTKDEAHDHFKRTMTGSKWAVLRGWHVLRHSFISICASKGIDQRLIDDFVGHQSEDQRRRYRHLFPAVKRDAINRAFGSKKTEPIRNGNEEVDPTE